MAESKAEPERRADRRNTATTRQPAEGATTRMDYDGVCGSDCIRVVHENDHAEERSLGRIAEPMS